MESIDPINYSVLIKKKNRTKNTYQHALFAVGIIYSDHYNFVLV